jgi:hypothetical protein
MHEKYLKGGSLNPYWVNEILDQQVDVEFDILIDYLDRATELQNACLEAQINLQLAQIEFEREQREIEFRNKLEIAYDFFKTHSDTREKKELCKYVIGATCRL